jgi:hypothetical protein
MPKPADSIVNPPPPDTINEAIGVLTRREVEARVLAPVIAAMAERFGQPEVGAVLRETIVEIAERQGVGLATLMGGNSMTHFMDSLRFWTRDDALEIEHLEQTDTRLAFNVRRCRYAELYASLGLAELGTTLSCARDFALIKGFNPAIRLERTQTIMEGAPFCDFRYRMKGA